MTFEYFGSPFSINTGSMQHTIWGSIKPWPSALRMTIPELNFRATLIVVTLFFYRFCKLTHVIFVNLDIKFLKKNMRTKIAKFYKICFFLKFKESLWVHVFTWLIHIRMKYKWILQFQVLKDSIWGCIFRHTQIRYTPLLTYAKSSYYTSDLLARTWFYSCYMDLWPQRPAP